MKLVNARLVKRRTDNGLMELNDDVPLGRLYLVDLDSRCVKPLHNLDVRIDWSCDMVLEIQGGWLPVELLEFLDETQPDFIAYAIGPVYASICTTLTDRDTIEERMNAEHPTGITSSWVVSSNETFANGQPMPHPCERDPGRTHWLVNC